MLEILRQKSSSYIVKGILGTIVIVFIFFFGSQTMRRATDNSQVAAMVNGNPIYFNTLKGMMQIQKENNPQLQYLPPESFDVLVRKSTLNNLIQSKLVESEALKLGLRVTDEEVGSLIKENPNLIKDGQFDVQAYRERFRPGFKMTYGLDYEDWIRSNLLQEKMEALFKKSVVVTDEIIKNKYLLDASVISVKKIALRPQELTRDFTPSEESINQWVETKKQTLKTGVPIDEAQLKKEALIELTLQEGQTKIKQLTQDLWPLFTQGKLTKEILEKQGLQESDIPETPLSEVESLFSGQADPGALEVLLALTPDKPYPEKPLETGKTTYFFKLIEKKSASMDDFEKNKPQIKETLQAELASHFFEDWIQNLIQKADIKINEPQS